MIVRKPHMIGRRRAAIMRAKEIRELTVSTPKPVTINSQVMVTAGPVTLQTIKKRTRR
jgi:hypothetical protein